MMQNGGDAVTQLKNDPVILSKMCGFLSSYSMKPKTALLQIVCHYLPWMFVTLSQITLSDYKTTLQ